MGRDHWSVRNLFSFGLFAPAHDRHTAGKTRSACCPTGCQRPGVLTRRLRCEPLEDRRMLSVLMVDADAPAAGDGLAWATALNDLQPALTQAATLNADPDPANDIDSIWIAEGTYKPSALLESGDARSASFSLVNNVALHGGFAGVETTLDQRDPTAHPVTLSGDLGTADDKSDNAYTVVYCGSNITTALDGVSITGGNADGSSDSSHPERQSGGGICTTGTLTVTNSTLSNNSAKSNGGGIYTTSTLTVTNSTLSNNSAACGGGIYTTGTSSTLTVTHSTFSSNGGGGIVGFGSSDGALTVTDCILSGDSASGLSGSGISGQGYGTVTIRDCAISGNSTGIGGGGIYTHGSGAVTVADCAFAGNSAGVGGGIYSSGSGEVTVANCAFSNNSANMGGGIYRYGSGLLTVTNCTFSGNSASSSDSGGGGIYASGMVTIVDSTFSNNSASHGGGLYGYGSGTVMVSDSVFSDNSASVGGGGIHNSNNSRLTVTRCTLSDNAAFGTSGGGGGVYNSSSGTLTVTDCSIFGNSAIFGGAIYNSGTLAATDSAFVDNWARRGGGVYGSGIMKLTNSTFSGNWASEFGGAMSGSGMTTVTNCTIVDNWTTGTGGGGIYLSGSSSTTTLNNTIVAGNTGPSGPDILVASGVLSGSCNLIANGAGQSALVHGVNGNLIGSTASPIDALLGGFIQFDNGLWGYCPMSGSPALDVGDNSLAVDPSGLPLTEDIAGNSRIQNGTVDIGAVEGTTAGSPAQTYVVASLDDTIAVDGVLTFREAFEAANGNRTVGDAPAGSFTQQDVIQFANGLSGTIRLDDGELTVMGNLRIEGPGADLLIFDANGQSRIFSVWRSASLNLVGVTIAGGAATDGGGIFGLGSLILANCALSGNVATSRNGGGVYSLGTLTASGCMLSDNSAGNAGGGIYGMTNTTTIANCTFWGNSANVGGGISNDSGALTVVNSSFSGNRTTVYGGAIHSVGSSNAGTLTIVNSTLSGNSSDKFGGGLFSYGTSATTTLNNTIIAGNTAATAPDIHDMSGTLSGSNNLVGDGSGQMGLVNGENGNQIGTASSPIDPLLSDWSRFGNRLWGFYLLPGSPALDAGNSSLAIDALGVPLVEDIAGNARIQIGTVDIGSVEGATTDSPGRIYVVTSLDNTIASDGIVTFREAFEAANGNLQVGDALAGSSTQKDVIRFAEAVSGTVAMERGELLIYGKLDVIGPGADLFTLDAQGRSRAFLIWWTASVGLSGMTIAHGSADEGGGILNLGTLMATHCIISNSTAESGGGICNDGSMELVGCTLSENSAHIGGGIFNKTGTLSLSDCTISGNSVDFAEAHGGGICNSGSGVLTAMACTFSNNSSTGDGGGVFNDTSSLLLSDCTISGNRANVYGGGICNAGEVTTTDCAVLANMASIGGGICSSSTLMVIGCAISDNSAAFQGGGISASDSVMLTVVDSTFLNNSSQGEGGGVYSLRSGTLDIANCVFSDNSTTRGGGGFYNSGPNSTSQTIMDCAFSANTAGYGGGLCLYGSLAVTNCSFADNSSEQGGAVFVSGSNTLPFSGCVFSANSSSYGGGVYIQKGALTVMRSTFSDNSALRGGGIYNLGSLTATDCAFVDNSVASYGGGICCFESGGMRIMNCGLSGNSAKYGGGVFSYSGAMTISDCILSGNSATSGGGVFGNGGGVAITNSTLWGNSASSGGGLACASGTSTTVNNTIVAGNSATDGSADIQCVAGTLSGSHNLIGDGLGQWSFANGVNGNIVGTAAAPIDAKLDSRGVPMLGSPAINKGSNALAVDAQGNPLATDLDGTQRIVYGTVDIGAFEFRMPGDVNLDAKVGEADAQVMNAHWMMQDATWTDGDLTGDGQVDGLDAAVLIAHWGERLTPRLPGDANDDGTVNDTDAAILAAHWLMRNGVTWDDGDFNADGVVDDRDAAILAAHWVRGTEAAPVEETPNEPTANPATQPVADEPISDAPISNDPISNGPVADEPISDAPISDEPISNEPISNDPVTKSGGEADWMSFVGPRRPSAAFIGPVRASGVLLQRNDNAGLKLAAHDAALAEGFGIGQSDDATSDNETSVLSRRKLSRLLRMPLDPAEWLR